MTADADRAAALVSSDLLADVAEEYRGNVVAEILHRHAGSPETPIADVVAAFKVAEPWWLTMSAEPTFDGPNPFAPATINYTQASILTRDNPALAARLRAEVGA